MMAKGKRASPEAPTGAVWVTSARGEREPDGNDADSKAVELLQAMLTFRRGDFSTRLPAGSNGVYGKIADAFNDVLEMSERRALEWRGSAAS